MTTGQLCISIRAVEQEQAALTDAVEDFLVEHDVPSTLVARLQVAIDEVLTNIIRHAYGPDVVDRFASIHLTIDSGTVTAVISDAGRQFDPRTISTPDPTLDIDVREPGGLGILLVRRLMDDVRYARVGDQNILTLIKART